MNNSRKDVSPKDTVKKIKKILKDNKINVKEYKIKNIKNCIYSVRIEIKGFYNMGTNGKGTTKTLALASAYAELMERIQSRILINNYCLNKNDNLLCFSTEILDENKLNNNYLSSFFSTKEYNILFDKCDKYKVLDKYKNLITNDYNYLPSKLIYLTSSSNGLCAGNNYYEALNQGCFEIFERYIYQKILFDNLTLKNVTNIEKLPVYSLINKIKENGYTVIIKDCTNSDSLPVIGVLLLKNNKYLFTIGSDCNINIAIERCLTEAFQGLDGFLQLNNKMKNISNDYEKFSESDKYINWMKCYTSNNGIIPYSVINEKSSIGINELTVFNNLESNIEVYNYILDIIKKQKLDIFVKDYSYMGFNTYKVFIPTLSNISIINDNELLLYKNYDTIKKCYFDINNNSHLFSTIIPILKSVMNIERYKYISFGEFFHINRYLKTNYNNITFSFLVGLLELKLYNEVTSINEISDIKIREYFEKINSIDNTDKYNYVLSDLKLKTPSCPNCNNCKLKNKCKYKNWKKLNDTLRKKEALFKY